jgi:protein SCO1/2
MRRLFHRSYWVVALLAVFALSACAPYSYRGTVIEPPNPAPPITLTTADGTVFDLGAQRGSVVAIFFGFTNCPDVCPTELADMKAVRSKLGADADKLKVVFISVDPERDTPERVSHYAKIFDPSFIGLSGTRAELEPIYQAYGVTAIRRELPDSALGYTMDHSAFTYVIDPAGDWRLVFSMASSIDDRVSDIRHLIQTGA